MKAGKDLVFVVSISSFLAYGCSTFSISGDAAYTRLELGGEVGFTLASSPTLNTRNDIQDAFGFDEPENQPYGRIQVEAGPVDITMSGFSFDAKQSGTLEASFGSLRRNTDVETDFSLLNLRSTLYFFDVFDIIPLPYVSLMPGIGVELFDLDIDCKEKITNRKEDISITGGLPIVSAKAQVDVGIFQVILEGGGLKVDYKDEIDGTFYDLEGLVKVFPVKNLSFFAGYRYVNLDGDGKDNDDNKYDIDLSIKGFFVGGGLRF